MTAPLTHPAPSIPGAVAAFAEERGAGSDLPAVLALTREVFSREPLRLYVEADPEIADDQRVIVEVVVAPGTGAAELSDARSRWISGLARLCRSLPRPVFCLRMVAEA
jgi:hypothetical protein